MSYQRRWVHSAFNLKSAKGRCRCWFLVCYSYILFGIRFAFCLSATKFLWFQSPGFMKCKTYCWRNEKIKEIEKEQKEKSTHQVAIIAKPFFLQTKVSGNDLLIFFFFFCLVKRFVLFFSPFNSKHWSIDKGDFYYPPPYL